MQIQYRNGIYEKYIKRCIDITCAVGIIICFSWLYLIISVLVYIKMGAPLLFKQPRPGMIDPNTGKECIFDMMKFRTMTNERDKNGMLLPDERRLPAFGKMLRATSLDELPEVINILRGDMSFIGPRPQLVRDLVFMSDKVRMRHTVKPGLSGLAQVNGRNAVDWEQKFEWDLKYIKKISFIEDLKIFGLTIKKVLFRSESDEELNITDDYGDWLLKNGRITEAKYRELQMLSESLIAQHQGR